MCNRNIDTTAAHCTIAEDWVKNVLLSKKIERLFRKSIYSTSRKTMAHFTEILSCGNFYQYDGELYTNHFPQEWAQNHMDGTGPKSCNNCRYFGSWNGVFVGYCANCAQYDYEFSRGHGFIEPSKERYENTPQARAMETYLCEVDFDNIGDKDLFDSSIHEFDILSETSEYGASYGSGDVLSEASEYRASYESDDDLNTARIMDDDEIRFVMEHAPSYQ